MNPLKYPESPESRLLIGPGGAQRPGRIDLAATLRLEDVEDSESGCPADLGG